MRTFLSKLKQLKIFAGWLVILATILVFANFILKHPEVWWQLQETSLWTILLLLILYSGMTTVLAVMYKIMAQASRAAINSKDNFLLTMYSSVVNFFGPLQSGPGFRTVYLKKKYNINIPAYVGLTLVYYLCFGVLSAVLLLSGVLGYWIIPLAVAGIIVLYILLPAVMKQPFVRKKIPKVLPVQAIAGIALLSLAQIVFVVAIYYTELVSIQPGISLSQAVMYTGAANFALFVSLTPGALGFRESFLYFSKDLHHISESTIVSANILDRAVYLLFLALLVVVIAALHGQSKFNAYKTVTASPKK